MQLRFSSWKLSTKIHTCFLKSPGILSIPMEKNNIFEPLGDSFDFLQNNDTFEKMRDVGSQEKNEIFENLGDFADSHPKNGKFPITGDLADSDS